MAPKDLKPDSAGKRQEIWISVRDSCGDLAFFKTIADKVGKNLNNTNWTRTVDNFGTITAGRHRGRVAGYRQVRRRQQLLAGVVRSDVGLERRLEGVDPARATSPNPDNSTNSCRTYRRSVVRSPTTRKLDRHWDGR